MFEDYNYTVGVINGTNEYLQMQEIPWKMIFKSFKRVKKCGVSFMTKYFYFIGKALNLDQYPLIFDDRVANALVQIVAPEIASFLQIQRGGKVSQYQEYNRFIHQAAQELEVEADQIELFLFKLKT